MHQVLLNSAPWWAWLGFHLLVLLMLALDLGVFNRRSHVPSLREASAWTLVWAALSLAFNALLWKTLGARPAAEFLTGYLLEKALSVDNLFVFILLFTAFQVPPAQQRRILTWGVLGALILRGSMILLGTALLNRFSWMIFLFGGFLIYTGLKLFLTREPGAVDPASGWIPRLFKRLVPYDPEGGYDSPWIRKAGKWVATPMLMTLFIVELTDLLFAVDSVPAVLAVTRNPFIVYTSNVFAILGLRSLYFLLAKLMDRFHYLKWGLAFILTFVGLKMCLVHLVDLPIHVSLLVIALVLAGCIIASLIWPAMEEKIQ